MKKLFKLLFKVLLVLIGLFIIISLLVALFVDINHYKDDVVELIKSETGLDMEINGDLELSVLSGIKFNAENIKLSHNKVIIADVEFINLGVALWSMYQGVPEITSLELAVRELNVTRDKKGNFNFLPLLTDETDKKSVKSTAKNSVDEKNNTETDKLFINNLSINDINLTIARFSYLDDLDSYTLKLEDVEASLSLLPIIKHYELVINDPRVLVAHSYTGKLTAKQALSNQYQLTDIALDFNNKKGDFFTDKFSFSLIQRGKNHGLPPLTFAAKGKLQFKLSYSVQNGVSKPLWDQPELIKVAKLDVNLSGLQWNDDDYQLEANNIHLILDKVSVYENKKYALDDLLLRSLALDNKQVTLIKTPQGEYRLKNTVLQLNDFPVFHKGKSLQLTSRVFFKQFAEGGRASFSIDSIEKEAQEFKNIKVLLEAKDKGIALSTLSLNALDSEVIGKGYLSLQKQIPQWQLQIDSEGLNLQPVSKLLNFNNKLTGIVSIHNQLSGTVQNSDFKVASGTVKVRGNNLEVSGLDLDKVLDDFQSTQRVGLMDVGATALLGPAGMLVTKGNDYRNLTASLDNQGSSKVKQLSSDISFVNDIATMNDTAFATEKHRVALKGKIDIENQLFKGFQVATVDQYGCPIYKEEVMGSLDSPTVKKVNILTSGIINPISSVVTKVTKTISKQCEVPFYTGVVKHPSE